MEENDFENDQIENEPFGVYACSMCGFRYIESRGNDRAGFSAGTRWSEIPDSFQCPVCKCPKNIFKRVCNDKH